MVLQAGHLAGRAVPAYRVTYRLWSDTNQAYGPVTVLQAGSGGPTLAIYNGSVSGTKAAYAADNTRFSKITAPASDLVLISYGHNESGPTYPSFSELTWALADKRPAAGIVPVLQNPEGPPGRSTADLIAQARRNRAVVEAADANGWPVIDAYSAFRADGRLLTGLVPDGVHPSAAGQNIWAKSAEAVFTR